MPDILKEEMRKTAVAKAPDKKTGQLARLFCQQAFRLKDVEIVDDRRVVGPNLDFNFMDELAVFGVVYQMCLTYGLYLDMEKHQRNWIVRISRPDDHAFLALSDARSSILRRAILQAAIQAHSNFVEPGVTAD
jgi:hypothetical protein